MKSRKKNTKTSRSISSIKNTAKRLAAESARLRAAAAEIVGNVEQVHSKAHRAHEGTERFHDSTGDLETTIHNVEVQNRLNVAKAVGRKKHH